MSWWMAYWISASASTKKRDFSQGFKFMFIKTTTLITYPFLAPRCCKGSPIAMDYMPPMIRKENTCAICAIFSMAKTMPPLKAKHRANRLWMPDTRYQKHMVVLSLAKIHSHFFNKWSDPPFVWDDPSTHLLPSRPEHSNGRSIIAKLNLIKATRNWSFLSKRSWTIRGRWNLLGCASEES